MTSAEFEREIGEKRYHFYIEWTFKDEEVVDHLRGPGPYHTRLTTDCEDPRVDWHRMKKVVVIKFSTREECDAYWKEKSRD